MFHIFTKHISPDTSVVLFLFCGTELLVAEVLAVLSSSDDKGILTIFAVVVIVVRIWLQVFVLVGIFLVNYNLLEIISCRLLSVLSHYMQGERIM